MSVNGHGNGNGAAPAPATKEEIALLAETEARELLGVSLDEAYAMVDGGELDGTAAEAEFKMLRFLLAG